MSLKRRVVVRCMVSSNMLQSSAFIFLVVSMLDTSYLRVSAWRHTTHFCLFFSYMSGQPHLLSLLAFLRLDLATRAGAREAEVGGWRGGGFGSAMASRTFFVF